MPQEKLQPEQDSVETTDVDEIHEPVETTSLIDLDDVVPIIIRDRTDIMYADATECCGCVCNVFTPIITIGCCGIMICLAMFIAILVAILVTTLA